MSLACPSCGFLTIDEDAYGTYNICTICGWEDDQVQLANPCSRGGANKESLYESQIKSLDRWPMDVKEYQGFKRGSTWRPLSPEEVRRYDLQVKSKPWGNKGVLYESEAYWNLPT